MTPASTKTCVLIVVASLALTACDRASSRSGEEYIQRAQDFQDKGDIQAGIIELKNAVQAQPDNAQARFLLGQFYLKTRQGSSAEKELLKAKELGVKDESVKVLLGEAFLMQEEYKRVLDEILTNLATTPLNKARILRQRGEAKIGLGQMDEACNLFQSASTTAQDYAPAYRDLAKCSIAHRNYEEARSRIDTALKLDAQDADNWAQLGDLELLRGHLDVAKSAFLKAQGIDPGHVHASMGLVSIYLRNNDLAKAVSEVQAARKQNPGSVLVRYNEAMVNYRQGKYKQAHDQLQEILRNVPNHMPSILLSGAVEFTLGSYEQAYQNISRFLQQHPNNFYAAKILAATDIKLNQPQAAIQLINNLLAAAPDDAQVLALAGTAYGQVKDYTKSTDYFEKAAAIDPKNANIRTGLAYTHLATGDTERAIASLESAVSLDPTRLGTDALLVTTYMRQKDYDKALVAAQMWLKSQPNNPLIYNLEGGIYLARKNPLNARKAFTQALTVSPTYLPAAENLAKLDLTENNPAAARQLFEKILSQDKNNVGVMLNLADLAKMAGQNQDYVDWLGKAIKAKPEILQPYRTLVTYYLNNKNTKNALSTALLAQTNNPGNPDVLDLLGATQIAVGKKTEALTTYNHLVNLAPKSLLAFMRLGSLQVLMQDSTNARLSFKQALDLRPDSPEAQTALLKLDVQAGDYSAALARAQQMQRAQAGNGLGYNLEGDVLMVQKQYSQAAKAYAKALEVSKNGLFAIKQQQALSIAGLKTEAEATLLTWLKKTPGDLQTRLYLGDLYGQSGRYSEAIEQYQYILGKGGSSVPLLNNLAWSYARLKDPRALPTAEKAYQSAPTNAVILDTYGWILLEQGNAARAVQLLKNAADKSTSPAIHYHLAAALVKSGNTAQARMELEQLLRNSANFPDKVAAQTLLNTLRH